MTNDKIPMTNEIQNPNAKVYDLEDRTALFGEAIIDLTRSLPRNDITQIMVRQLVRSATSIGANYMEADGALSKKDFRHCIGICRKEAKESRHWLRMLIKIVPEHVVVCQNLSSEAQELVLIFSAIIRSSS